MQGCRVQVVQVDTVTDFDAYIREQPVVRSVASDSY